MGSLAKETIVFSAQTTHISLTSQPEGGAKQRDPPSLFHSQTWDLLT